MKRYPLVAAGIFSVIAIAVTVPTTHKTLVSQPVAAPKVTQNPAAAVAHAPVTKPVLVAKPHKLPSVSVGSKPTLAATASPSVVNPAEATDLPASGNNSDLVDQTEHNAPSAIAVPDNCTPEQQGLACYVVTILDGVTAGTKDYYCNHYYDGKVTSILALEGAPDDAQTVTCSFPASLIDTTPTE